MRSIFEFVYLGHFYILMLTVFLRFFPLTGLLAVVVSIVFWQKTLLENCPHLVFYYCYVQRLCLLFGVVYAVGNFVDTAIAIQTRWTVCQQQQQADD